MCTGNQESIALTFSMGKDNQPNGVATTRRCLQSGRAPISPTSKTDRMKAYKTTVEAAAQSRSSKTLPISMASREIMVKWKVKEACRHDADP